MTEATVPPLTLNVEHVSVRFGGLTALNDVSFSIAANEIVGLIGPNGAGKTTAFNVVCGFLAPSSGTVRFPALGRENLRPAQLAKAGVARTLQGVGLFDRLSVIENVMAGAQSRPGGGFLTSLLGLPVSSRRERLVRDESLVMLDRLGVARFAKALPSSIPYGIAKKVAVARALMGQPKFMMLDEPASGLDETELSDFAVLISGLKDTMSVLLVEHNMDFVMPLVDRLVVLNFGQVIASGPPSVISHDEAVLAAYLGVEQ
jgi:branched-chain amino acid transport system ATP-binding protein